MEGADNASTGHETDRVTSESDRDVSGLVAGIVAALIVTAGAAACLAAVHRGFDLTDEGYYVLTSLHPKYYLRSSTDFQLITGPILSLVRGIWILRAVNLVALLLSSIFFAWSYLQTAPVLLGAAFHRSDRLVVGAAIASGALAPSAFLPQTPGYNQITLSILLCSAGLLLLLADGRLGHWSELCAWIGVGILMWIQFVVKWPAIVATIPFLVLAVWRATPRARGRIRCIGLIVGGGALAALFTDVVVPLRALLGGLRQGSRDLAVTGHGPWLLLRQNAAQLWSMQLTVWRSYWFLFPIAVVGAVLCAKSRRARVVAITLGIGLCFLTPALVHHDRALGGVSPFSTLQLRASALPAYVAFCLAAGATALVVRRRVPLDRRMLYIGALLAMPLLSAVGTNNPIWFNALFGAVFWIAAGLAITSQSFAEHSPYVLRGIAIAFATLIAYMAVYGTWSDPYRQLPLSQDSVTVVLPGPAGSLQVDPATAGFIREIRSAVHHVTGAHRPLMVAWASIPGAPLAGGVLEPVFPWLVQGSVDANLSLKAGCQQRDRGILVLKLPGAPEIAKGARELPATCSGRTWVKLQGIDAPWWVAPHLDLYYAAPVA